jgi:hypothetical protein
MANAVLEESRLKSLLKEALIEVFEEKRDLMRGLVEEVLEDAHDLAAFEERQHEPNLAFEDVLSDLRSRGKL